MNIYIFMEHIKWPPHECSSEFRWKHVYNCTWTHSMCIRDLKVSFWCKCVKKIKEPHALIWNVDMFDVFWLVGYCVFGILHLRGGLDLMNRLSNVYFRIWWKLEKKFGGNCSFCKWCRVETIRARIQKTQKGSALGSFEPMAFTLQIRPRIQQNSDRSEGSSELPWAMIRALSNPRGDKTHPTSDLRTQNPKIVNPPSDPKNCDGYEGSSELPGAVIRDISDPRDDQHGSVLGSSKSWYWKLWIRPRI